MRKFIISLIAALMVAVGFVAVTSSSASAVTNCGAWFQKSGGVTAFDLGNLNGGIHQFQITALTRDCTGGDQVAWYRLYMTKQNGNCRFNNGAGLGIGPRSYTFNPNVLGGFNGGARTFPCHDGARYYYQEWNPSSAITLTSGMASSARCLGFAVKVDRAGMTDVNHTTDSVCWNGA